MKKVETLAKIKEAEGQAKQMKSDALKEKERIIRNAKRESLFVFENMEKKGAELHNEKLSEVEAGIQRERTRLLEEGKEKGETLKNQASAKIDEAVDFLIKRFEDGVLHAKTERDE
jgi:vacuolar-type H+-ATPase subunit H